jgi:hypothetical protein
MKNYNQYYKRRQIRWIVGGLTALLSAGMIASTWATTGGKDSTTVAQPLPYYTSDNKTVPAGHALVHTSLDHHHLIGVDGKPTKHMASFLKLLGIRHKGTASSVKAALETCCLKKTDLESRSIVDKDTEKDKKVRQQALSILKDMDFVEAIPQKPAAVDYFLLFGANLQTAEKRFNDFVRQYQAGKVVPKNIVFLSTNERLHASELQSIKKSLGVSLTDFLKEVIKKEALLTKGDIWHFLWKTKAPKELKDAFPTTSHLFFVETKDVTPGQDDRTTTLASLEEWIATAQPAPGSLHANAEKPYAIRIDKEVRWALERHVRTLPPTTQPFSISWNSSAAASNLSLAVYKDEVARAFAREYELKKLLGCTLL